jgi:hypothetical protein
MTNALALFCLLLAQATPPTIGDMKPAVPVDVPAITITVPADHPCNLKSPYAVCLTGPETRWTCEDKTRILLTAEDGTKHCVAI